MTAPLKLKVAIIGKGKVGIALARAARTVGSPKVTLRAAREGIPSRVLDADLVVLCVRDRELGPLALALAASGVVPKRASCVHVAGALDGEVLAPLRAVCRGVAQMHPMISFADKARPPHLKGGHVHVRGDEAAERHARTFVRAIGMVARTFPALDTVGYHAAAAFVANGAAVLAALGARILEASGVPSEVAPAMLGPLLHSVADNVEALGFPACLTGPVRRGDPNAIDRHGDVLAQRVPQAVPLFIESALAQVPMARALGDGPEDGFNRIEESLLTMRNNLSRAGLPPNLT